MRSMKLERPPYVHNWVRYIHADVPKTTKALVSFGKAAPPITYAAAGPLIFDRIAYGLDRTTALQAALTRGRENSRTHVAEFVSAFYDFDEVRNYSGLPSYDQFVEPYRASRNIKIPVKPLIVISEAGLLKPLFVVGWASMPLSIYQRRLLMTVIEDAVFSLTDFRESTGEFISFPRVGGDRQPECWHRGDFELLSKSELADQLAVYLEALENAKSILRTLAVEKGEKPRDRSRPVDPSQKLLF